jgi:hypothetical protein
VPLWKIWPKRPRLRFFFVGETSSLILFSVGAVLGGAAGGVIGLVGSLSVGVFLAIGLIDSAHFLHESLRRRRARRLQRTSAAGFNRRLVRSTPALTDTEHLARSGQPEGKEGKEGKPTVPVTRFLPSRS